MRLCSIASGSSGNCIYVGTDKTHIIIDAGISARRIMEGLDALGVKAEELSGILITHEHTDHTSGLKTFLKKNRIPVYAVRGTYDAMLRTGAIPEGLYSEIIIDKKFDVGDIAVLPFSVCHDAASPCAYRFENGEKAAAAVTDLGSYDGYTVKNLTGLDAVFLEANHDIHMLEAGPYPYELKCRIRSMSGHLSNDDAGRLLSEIMNGRLKHVMLCHLSKENNYPPLAVETVRQEALKGAESIDDTDIEAAERDRMSDIVYI